MTDAMPKTSFPLRIPALKVDQPIGSFFAVVLPARTLLEICYTKAVTAKLDPASGSYVVDGAQRLEDPKRLKKIGEYIDEIDASFPNSIIIAANFEQDVDRVEADIDTDVDEGRTEDELQQEFAKRWKVAAIPVYGEDGAQTGERYELIIPTAEKLARVIDGQHRLFAFGEAKAEGRLDVQLLCAVFIDLPPPMQASIFATINSNQKPVDKSLTYELFGYNVADESEDRWSPDKLAVFLARRLATDDASMMKGLIGVAPKNDFVRPKNDDGDAKAADKSRMKISFATVVSGIVRVISANPKKDANTLRKRFFGKRSSLELGARNIPPLRDAYLKGDDQLIYDATRNFVNACWTVFWEKAPANSFIRKTVGVQALFDIYREIAGPMYADGNGDMRQEAFEARLRPAAKIDFANVRFQNASGSNRTAIRRILRVKLGLLPVTELPPGDEVFIADAAGQP